MFGWIAMLIWREAPSVGWGLPWQVRRGGAHLHINMIFNYIFMNTHEHTHEHPIYIHENL
jgi:hypothetical protein